MLKQVFVINTALRMPNDKLVVQVSNGMLHYMNEIMCSKIESGNVKEAEDDMLKRYEDWMKEEIMNKVILKGTTAEIMKLFVKLVRENIWSYKVYDKESSQGPVKPLSCLVVEPIPEEKYNEIFGDFKPLIDWKDVVRKDVEVWNDDLRTELAGSITNTGAIRQGEVDLSSGKKGTYYVDIKKACTNPPTFWLITESISKIITTLPYTIEAVAGIELGSVPIASCVSRFDPLIIVRKAKKGYGVGGEVIGDVRDKRIIMIEDVTTTGSSSIKAIKRIREEGGIVKDVITVVDRNEGAKECLEGIGVGLIPLLEFKNSELC